MSRTLVPWLVAGGATAAILYLGTRRRRVDTSRDRASLPDGRSTDSDPSARNAALTYRSVGATGEPYPDWVRALDGKSGVYVLRERQRDGSTPVVYVGQSQAGRLYQTLTRHFQTWRRAKKFWTGQYGGQGHDPGLTYNRDRITAAVSILPAEKAIAEEARLITRLRPRDNLVGQPVDEDPDEVIPF
jgi:hypothetical protein